MDNPKLSDRSPRSASKRSMRSGLKTSAPKSARLNGGCTRRKAPSGTRVIVRKTLCRWACAASTPSRKPGFGGYAFSLFWCGLSGANAGDRLPIKSPRAYRKKRRFNKSRVRANLKPSWPACQFLCQVFGACGVLNFSPCPCVNYAQNISCVIVISGDRPIIFRCVDVDEESFGAGQMREFVEADLAC